MFVCRRHIKHSGILTALKFIRPSGRTFMSYGVHFVTTLTRVKFVGCKSALAPSPHPTTPEVYSTDRSKAVVPVLVLLFVALWFILRGDLF